MNQRAFPISFSFLGALIVSVLCVLFCLAWVVSRLPNLLYAYSDNVSITWLFSKGYFHAVLRTLLPGNAYPIQQINFPLAILFSITAWIPISSLFLLWLGQSLLGILLLFRSSRLVSSDYSLERFVFIALVLAHPRFWILLTISPDQILIALLFVEALLQCQSRIEIGVRGGIALLLLTMTGCDGFMWAAILAFSVSLVTIPHFGSTSEIFRKRWFYALGSIVPAGFLFLFLSLQYGQPGGVRLSDYPTLFSEISFTRLLHGDWTRNIGDFLLWMANGFISMPFPLPVWGGLALLGLTDGWMKSGSRQIFDRSCGMMCFFAVFLYAFLPAAEAHRASMPLLLLTAYFAMRGLSWFAETVSVSTWTATAVGGGLLAVLAAMHTPGEWSPIVQRARYHQSLFQILDREIDPLLLHANNSAAIRFNPTIFSRLSSPERIYPVGLSLQGFIDGSYGEMGGIYFDLRFAPAPALVILYPQIDERIGKPSLTELDVSFPRISESLNGMYQPSSLYRFMIYRRIADPREIVKNWLASAREEGYQNETRLLPEAFLRQFDDASIPPPSLDEDTLPQPIGLQWDFDRDNRFTRQIGTAFGLRPSPNYRASGISGVGTGSGLESRPTDDRVREERRMGILHSDPFIIEGDTMSFFAGIPKNSTSTFFCLAVYEELPFGRDAIVQRTRHVFEHLTGESLMSETFFYVFPQHLSYWPDRVRGWHVVHLLQESDRSDWQWIQWSLSPWKNKQALWLAADRDLLGSIRIDQILQWKRAPGQNWDFEDGTYKDWQVSGEAFYDRPSIGPIGGQTPIRGYEGNYFINSYLKGSDLASGTISSPTFVLQGDRMRFRIGGGQDEQRLYVGLRINGNLVLRTTGDRSETLRSVTWDISPWIGHTAQVEISDQSSGVWGHILADEIRIFSSPRLH